MTILRTYHHPDHASTWLSTSLGSSASTRLNNLWITDNTGQPIQHLHYLPFGEDWIDQRNTSWNAPYTFSGKEKDVETGYGYFGARYYDSGLSIWLSVDPMSDKYPSMSPYNYCANNPVIYKDPDGKDKIEVGDDGRVIKIIQQEGNDILVSKKTGDTEELSGHGVFRKSYFEKKNADGKVSSTFFMGLSNSDANTIFSFMGKNTDVEWGKMDAESNGEKFNLVGTDHNVNGETFVSTLVLNCPEEMKVNKYNHSHPLLSTTDRAIGGLPSNPKTVVPGSEPDSDVFQDMVKRHPGISIGINFRGQTDYYVRKGTPVEGYRDFEKFPKH